MRKPRLKTLIANQKLALKASPPKSRDKERRRLNELLMVERLCKEIKQERKAA